MGWEAVLDAVGKTNENSFLARIVLGVNANGTFGRHHLTLNWEAKIAHQNRWKSCLIYFFRISLHDAQHWDDCKRRTSPYQNQNSMRHLCRMWCFGLSSPNPSSISTWTQTWKTPKTYSRPFPNSCDYLNIFYLYLCYESQDFILGNLVFHLFCLSLSNVKKVAASNCKLGWLRSKADRFLKFSFKNQTFVPIINFKCNSIRRTRATQPWTHLQHHLSATGTYKYPCYAQYQQSQMENIICRSSTFFVVDS